MIEFKKNVKKELPYDREVYLDYLGNKFYNYLNWYWISIQLPGGFEGREIGLTEYLEAYESWFKNLILKLDNGSVWIVNHDKYDSKWFPNDEDNLTSLRALFKQNNVLDKFKGALIFSTEELLKFSKDLITYPLAVFNEERWLYDDLDISHGEWPFIIKISGHANINFLSTDKELLRKVVSENSLNRFVIIDPKGVL